MLVSTHLLIAVLACSIDMMFSVHEEDRLFGHAPATHRFSVGLVVLLSLAVLAFHVLLGRMVYQEFCHK
jgi:hypothetical protein